MSEKIIVPGQTIGIIGGGQLGRMMASSAREMGYNIIVLDPTPNSPCGQIADKQIVASYHDLEAIKQLAQQSDVITYEFENIDYEALAWLEEHVYLPQGSTLLKITQNRLVEKKAVMEQGVKVAPFVAVTNEEELIEGLHIIGFPAVLKTTMGGYDGKGQVVLKEQEDVKKAIHLLKQECILEGWVPFEKEVSVIVVRSVSGEVAIFPIAENIHIDNILHQSIVPARVTEDVYERATKIASHLANQLHLVGILAIEMFVTKDGEVYVNELAPRPHNSGHYTMNGCKTSQFQQHVRSICNWPLGETTLLSPTVMVNILGEHMEAVLENIPAMKKANLHLYGKAEAKVKRKMGHINIVATSIEEALETVDNLHIWKSEEMK
ncbi:MAG: 5-(carboxyamino)imidazole ribonucleotide synthase [Bacillaceae bacterium]